MLIVKPNTKPITANYVLYSIFSIASVYLPWSTLIYNRLLVFLLWKASNRIWWVLWDARGCSITSINWLIVGLDEKLIRHLNITQNNDYKTAWQKVEMLYEECPVFFCSLNFWNRNRTFEPRLWFDSVVYTS